MPASRRASKPAPIASCVVRPRAATRSASTPNSLVEVELAAASGQLEHVGRAVDRLEGCTLVALDQSGDVMVEHLVCGCLVGMTSMNCSPLSSRPRLASSKTCGGAGGTEGRTGDDDQFGVGRAAADRARRRAHGCDRGSPPAAAPCRRRSAPASLEVVCRRLVAVRTRCVPKPPRPSRWLAEFPRLLRGRRRTDRTAPG